MTSYRAVELNANLTKGTANLPDVIQLLRLWEPDTESPEEFGIRAVEENLLGKTSRSRAADVVSRILQQRYFPNGRSQPGQHLRHVVTSRVPRRALDRLLYYHAALAEHLLYRCATELVYDHRTRGVDQVRKADVRRWLGMIEGEGTLPRTYSESVTERLAQHLLAALRDFGILQGKTHKRIAPVSVPDEVVGYVTYSLKDEGHSAKNIIEHQDWRLFLLHHREVEDRMFDVTALGYFSYQAAGDVRRFDWTYNSLDEYVDAITAQ